MQKTLIQGTSTTLSLQSESDNACVTEMHAKRLMQAQDPKNGRQVELRREIAGHKSPMLSQLPDSEQDAWDLMSNPIPTATSKIHPSPPSDLAFLVGPNVSFYTSSHPIDPQIRNGSRGPEAVQGIVRRGTLRQCQTPSPNPLRWRYFKKEVMRECVVTRRPEYASKYN